MNPITLENVGPVRHLEIKPPEGGGIIVLKGRNGRGKTEALSAVEAAASGKTKELTITDGQKNGRVDALGVSIKLGRANRRTGELEVETLEGKLNVADLVDPRIKSPDAADAKRIKALVQLSGTEADIELFRQILPDRFDEVVGSSARESEEVLVMADRVKRDVDAEARKVESRADLAERNAQAAKQAAQGVDLDRPDDADALQADLETAMREESALKERAEAAEAARKRHDSSRKRVHELKERFSGPTVTVAEEVLHERRKELDSAAAETAQAQEALARAKERLSAAESAHGSAKERVEAADSILTSAREHAELVAELESRLEETLPPSVTDDQLAEASFRVAYSRKAVETGAVVRRAKEQLAAADDFAQEAKTHRKAAESLRESAKLTDEVLSDLVGKSGSSLRVEAGRLVLDTKRGVTYFAELSHGERWRLALDIAIEAVGDGGVFTVPQEAWESLDPVARREIAEHVGGRGVVVLTAEASEDEEIRAEAFAV